MHRGGNPAGVVPVRALVGLVIMSQTLIGQSRDSARRLPSTF